uniref:Uncharacterized protein n=1 Tax=Anopheles melas TaxID=34690 RepID=A0A182U931_9DIPT
MPSIGSPATSSVTPYRSYTAKSHQYTTPNTIRCKHVRDEGKTEGGTHFAGHKQCHPDVGRNGVRRQVDDTHCDQDQPGGADRYELEGAAAEYIDREHGAHTDHHPYRHQDDNRQPYIGGGGGSTAIQHLIDDVRFDRVDGVVERQHGRNLAERHQCQSTGFTIPPISAPEMTQKFIAAIMTPRSSLITISPPCTSTTVIQI